MLSYMFMTYRRLYKHKSAEYHSNISVKKTKHVLAFEIYRFQDVFAELRLSKWH